MHHNDQGTLFPDKDKKDNTSGATSGSNTSTTGYVWSGDKDCYTNGKKHPPLPRKLGDFEILLCAGDSIGLDDLPGVDLFIPLNGNLPRIRTTFPLPIICYELQDMSGVPESWSKFVHKMWDEIKAGKKIMAWCTGSHGRTGTLYASLLALAEPDVDPVETARARHCSKAVETQAQIEAVYAIAGKPVPDGMKASKSYGVAYTPGSWNQGTYTTAKQKRYEGWGAVLAGFLHLVNAKKESIYEQRV